MENRIYDENNGLWYARQLLPPRACITSRRRKTDWHLGAKAFAVYQRA